MKTPDLEAGKVLDMLDPGTAKSMIELRETGTRDPMLELKAKARMYMVKLLYAASHERTLHIPDSSFHPELGVGDVDYRTPIKSHSGQTLADVTHMKVEAPTSEFDKMHNWFLETMADPKKGMKLKGIIDSENFRARALEWYAAMNPADVPDELLPKIRVAVRKDRVVGRAEATRGARAGPHRQGGPL